MTTTYLITVVDQLPKRHVVH